MLIRSFRFRVFALSAFSFISVFLILLLLLTSNFKNKIYRSVDQDLVERASNLSSYTTGQPRIRQNEKIIEKVKDDYYQIINDRGDVIVSSITSDHLWPINRDLMIRAFGGSTGFETIRFREEYYRVVYFPISKSRIVSLAKSLEETDEIIAEMNRSFIIILIIFAAATIIISWFISKKAVLPLKEMISFGEELKSGRIKEIAIRTRGEEIERIVNIFKGIVENIKNLSETQKRFTQDVSHEIRSPLTSLRGNIEVALRKKRSTDEYEDVLRNNLFDVIRLIRITDDLLFLARADNNIIEIRKNWFDVNHLLKAIIERLDHYVVKIIEDYKEGIEYYGDINLLEQAISNIIQNSIKYTPEGGTIKISTWDDNSSIYIGISDSGIGIPEKDIPHIFERFYRVDKERSRKMGGTGLGLSIAKWIIDNHGGNITVKSTPGVGTTFTITLPKAD